MPRATVQRRRPTVNDLNESQREIFEALPTNELKEKFLAQLPDITVSSAQARRKAKLIRKRIELLESVLAQLESHKNHLARVARDLENGADPESVDLRHELKPPAISGVALRYTRRDQEREN